MRIKGIAGENSVTYPISIALRRRPQATGSDESGFVLILVLPVAMLLLMTALSLVTRSSSAAIASTQESRAQSARMAAEYGFNQLMARVNNDIPLKLDDEITIPASPKTKYITEYKIVSLTPDKSKTLESCSITDADKTKLKDYDATIEGRLFVNSSTIYTKTIIRTLSVCAPAADPKQFRVRETS